MLESLQVFKASRNNISAVCFELFSNPAVKLIDLSENQIAKLPEAASQCRSVAVLRLNNNNLTSLPTKSMNLESLTELDLSNNCLTCIQMHWALQPSLRNLKMNGNLLTDAHSWNGAGQDTPPTRTLEFHDNHFKFIPVQVFMFMDVTDLDISKNAIKKLPISIEMLTNRSHWEFLAPIYRQYLMNYLLCKLQSFELVSLKFSHTRSGGNWSISVPQIITCQRFLVLFSNSQLSKNSTCHLILSKRLIPVFAFWLVYWI